MKSYFKDIIYELMKVKGIKNYEKYFGEKEWHRLNSYINTPNRNKDRMYIQPIKYFAEMLDVPASFIVNAMSYNDIEELEMSTNE